jgi:cytosine/adenosine deaminase-related metal-dependent hydrolase
MRSTLYRATWVLPVTAPPIRDGAVLVDERGVIAAVGPAATLGVPGDALETDLGDAILLPGLVNAHAHPELAGMRGLIEDLPFHEWIPALRRARDRARLSAADHLAAARWTCVESIAAGITAMGATEDSGAALDALREAGLRGVVYREVFGPAPASAAAALQELRAKVADMRARETDLVRSGISPHAPYTVSDELFRLAAAWAITENLPMAVHAAEAEVEQMLVTSGTGPFAAGLRTRGIATPPRARSTVALLEATGVLAVRPLLIHCVRVDAEDIRMISDSGAAVAHCPVANARLGHGVAPVLDLLESGACVALGTDSVASNNRIDLLEEGRTAQLMQRARSTSAGALPPDTLLRLATLDGARALGMDARVGSLEPGKDADLCAVSLSGPHVRPVIDPVATLFLSARGSDVILTVVRGTILYRAGHFTTLDPAGLRAHVDALGARLHHARTEGDVGRGNDAPAGDYSRDVR